MTDTWQRWLGGPGHMPFVQPITRRPIMMAQMPASLGKPPAKRGPNRTHWFVRVWGALPLEIVGPVTDDSAAGPNPAVAEDPSRIQRCEDVNCVRTIALAAVPLVWEVARCSWSAFDVASLERVGTYLEAQPLDAQGAPDGPPFVTGPNTPLCVQVLHPTLQETISFRWSIRSQTRAEDRLVAARPEFIPSSDGVDGLPWDWADFRYAWQSRYSDQQRSVLPNQIVRLFATLSTPTPARWRVNVGGILTAWWQHVNAWEPSIARQTVRTR